MQIKVNEVECTVTSGTMLAELIVEHKPGADLLVVNGFPQGLDYEVCAGDNIILIKRGEVPSRDEMAVLLRARQTPGLYEKLKNSVVGIAGIGGLGSNVAISLARCGVGELIIADFDVVEPSNLNRQAYFVEHLGMPKVQALEEILLKANPYLKITKHLLEIVPEVVGPLFERADVVVEAFDRAEAKAMLLNGLSTQLPDVPGVFASGLAGDGPCGDIIVKKVYNKHYLVGDDISAAAPNVGLLAPRVMMTAGMQANVVLRLLQGKDPLEDAT